MNSDITFGPADQQWHYSPSARTYDLSGGAEKRLTIATTEGPKETLITIAPEETALVIVDMQNFFLDSESMDHPHGLSAVEPTIKVIEKCREEGIQIIWLNWGLTDEDMTTLPAAVARGFMNDTLQATTNARRPWIGLGSDLGEGKGRCLFAGTWNADIYPPLKAHAHPADVRCAKNRMSGLWSPEQPLWKTLKAEEKNTILFTGVNTDQCVLGTFVDGYNAGFNCVMVDDCCGTTTEGGKEITFYNVATSYGFITNSASLLAAKAG